VTTSCVVTIGETMAMFRATSLGGIDLVSDFRLGIGGAESNVAIGLARLVAPVTWLGRVGEDSLGRRITRELMAEGVDARAIVDGAAATGLMIKERRTSDATRVLYYRAGSAGSRACHSGCTAGGRSRPSADREHHPDGSGGDARVAGAR